MLLRESFDTRYVLGWLDWTGDWTTVPEDMIQAIKDMNGSSIKFCGDKLSAWSRIDSGASHLAILEGQKLHNFGARQVLTNKPDLRDDAPFDNTEKCVVEGTEDIMEDTPMKEIVQGEKATKVNHGVEKT